ncbi:extracellular solute-binding protein [Paenibacillus senegalensis]|uniref:extracellular solute-binding protein n=1 Tax=Paenibacillus senegalensis TaxID=1465766 RepID=UPI000289A8C2|nr:extracellular solute-binding protein [Paenibacillus senegalensis]
MSKKKWAATVLTTAMSVGVLAACGSGGDTTGNGGDSSPEELANFNETGFPIVDEPINLTFLTGKSVTTANNWAETMLWQEYEKMTNIKVDFQLVPFDSLNERKNLSLAGGDYPDVFYTGRFTNNDLVKYGSEGTFIPLNDLIDQYAPNLKKILDENPDIRAGMTMPDGNIYGLPTIYDADFTSVLIGSKLWYNQEWLEALGMEEPQTVDDFYNYLVAVKNTDLNGNGQQDEIPLGSYQIEDLLNATKGWFGLMNRGTANINFDIDPETNELRYIPTSDRFKAQLEFMHKLFMEGLIEPEIFTNTANEFFAKGAENVYGAVLTTSPDTLMGMTTFVGLPALEGPFGDKMATKIRSPLVGSGPFVITDKNEHPEATVRWMDYFYGDEGARMYFMGFEGESYEVTENGEFEYTEEIRNNPQGLTLEQALVKYVTWPGGSYPGIVRQDFFKGAESLPESIEAAEKLKPYLIDEIWPVFTFTPEESTQYTALHSDIDTYAVEMRAKFISGQTPFSEWDNYVETLNRMGLDRYMDIHQASLDRYLERQQ